MFRIQKTTDFLHLAFCGQGNEADHLLHYTEMHRRNNQERIAQMSQQGHTVRHIATELNLPATTVFRAMKRLGPRPLAEDQPSVSSS